MITRSLLLASLIFYANSSVAATLGLDQQAATLEKGSLRIPVSLSALNGDAVAALQFDLYFRDPFLVFEQAMIGPAAENAEKTVHANTLRSGHVRVIVAGLNRNAMEEGAVAWIQLSCTAAAQETLDLRLGDVILSDPYGTPVATVVNPGAVTVDPGASLVVASSAVAPQTTLASTESLARYRALLFAGLVVALAIIVTRQTPRKGRAR